MKECVIFQFQKKAEAAHIVFAKMGPKITAVSYPLNFNFASVFRDDSDQPWHPPSMIRVFTEESYGP